MYNLNVYYHLINVGLSLFSYFHKLIMVNFFQRTYSYVKHMPPPFINITVSKRNVLLYGLNWYFMREEDGIGCTEIICISCTQNTAYITTAQCGLLCQMLDGAETSRILKFNVGRTVNASTSTSRLLKKVIYRLSGESYITG